MSVFNLVVPPVAASGDVLVQDVPPPHYPCDGACRKAPRVLRVGDNPPGVIGFASASARAGEVRRRLDAPGAVFVVLVWPEPSPSPFSPTGGQA